MMFDYSLFDTLLEPLFILNQEQKVVYCNETAEILCGLSRRKIQKHRFEELFELNESLEWLGNLQEVTDATAYKEVRFKNQEGQEGRIQITCRPLPGSQQESHWIIFARDVTLEERLQNKYRAELEQKEGYIEELQKAQKELEKYSKNLEKMVEERTREITRLNQQMKALLDSLHQGFLIFDAQGLCMEVSSKACLTVLEGAPSGRPIWDVLGLGADKVEGFKKWLITLFGEMLPFEDLAPLGPQHYPHSQGRSIVLDYYPLRTDSGSIEGVVVVATDNTSLVEAQKQAETERENARLIIKLIKNRREITRFILEAQSMLSSLKQVLQQKPADWNREELYRILHTVKGGCASFSVKKTADLCHEAEQLLADKTELNSISRIPEFKAKCEEIILAFNEFFEETKSILGEKSFSQNRTVEVPVQEIISIAKKVSHWNRGEELSQYLLNTYIMEPISSFFEPYKDVVQKVAEQEGKKVHPLSFHNPDIPVMPEAYANLFACMVHAFRNSVDHGIEQPEKRSTAGKDPEGKIEVHFNILSGDSPRLQICVIDDGAGIDAEKIRHKLQGKGYDTSSEDDAQIIQHIFDSELSTRDTVTATSGRGVGMDAILAAARKLGGKAWVESQVGQGTRLMVEVPYLTEASSVKVAA